MIEFIKLLKNFFLKERNENQKMKVILLFDIIILENFNYEIDYVRKIEQKIIYIFFF